MGLFQHEFWLGGAGYVLCHAFEAAHIGQPALAAGVSERVLRELLRVDGLRVRNAYAALTYSHDLYRISDHELLQALLVELGVTSSGTLRGRLALLERDSFGAQRPGEAPRGGAQDIVTKLLAQGVQKLLHRGQGYRLVPALEPPNRMASGDYEVVSSSETAALLREMAEDQARLPVVRALLREAADRAAAGPRVADAQRLVLLRLRRGGSGAREAARPPLQGEPAQTPSQLNAPRARETDWIEIRLVDDTGTPIAHQAYQLKLADGSARKGKLDAKGRAYVSGIPAGTCEVTFSDLAPRVTR